jgi:hypothetical protein
VWWGLPDPYVFRNAGARRHDEVTAALSWRQAWSAADIDGWWQVGAGALALGALGGEQLQSVTHVTLGQNLFDRRQEVDGLRVEPLAAAGGGVRVPVAGPVSFDLSALGADMGAVWARLRSEAVLRAAGSGGGMWLGMRLEASDGGTLSRTHDAVSAHEDGPAVIAGWGIRLDAVQLGFSTTRHLYHEHQEGVLTIGWTPGARLARGGETRWLGRFGLVAHDSLVGRRGTDLAIGRQLAASPWLVWLGYRDQEPVVPFALDLNDRRQLLWLGVGVAPVLWQGDVCDVTGLAEVGAGWRHCRVRSQGFVTVDGRNQTITDAAVARAALGGAVLAHPGGADVGLLVLVEGQASSQQHDVHLVDLDPNHGLIPHTERDMPLEGHAICGVLGLMASWRW